MREGLTLSVSITSHGQSLPWETRRVGSARGATISLALEVESQGEKTLGTLKDWWGLLRGFRRGLQFQKKAWSPFSTKTFPRPKVQPWENWETAMKAGDTDGDDDLVCIGPLGFSRHFANCFMSIYPIWTSPQSYEAGSVFSLILHEKKWLFKEVTRLLGGIPGIWVKIPP